MGMNFWEKLEKPFWILAPMEDVTDTVFRQVMIKAGRPNVFFTEFTSVDGIEFAIRGSQISTLAANLRSAPLRLEFAGAPVLQRLAYQEIERPIVAQIWGKDPEKFRKAAELIKELGFDGIDINMGCPDRAVLKQGCGAGLIGQYTQVAEILEAVRTGSGGLPVSVKTRLGNKKVEEGWMEFLLGQGLAALTIHARTAKEMSEVPARWEEVEKVVEARNAASGATNIEYRKVKIIGNGDIKSISDPRIAESGVDGAMIGRGVFENPFIFNSESRNAASGATKLEREQRLELLRYHLELWEETWGKQKHQIPNPNTQVNSKSKNTKQYLKDYSVMKKFFKMYIRGWEGAGELRSKLMETEKVEEALEYC